MESPQQTLVVTAAIVIQHGALMLCTRRPGSHLTGQWEFPGGKCQPGETLSQCIIRELQEELAIAVRVSGEVATLTHCYPEKTVELHFMRCGLTECSGMPIPQEGQQCGFFTPDQWDTLDFTPADKAFIESHRSELTLLCHTPES